jgi:hypothetical protein
MRCLEKHRAGESDGAPLRRRMGRLGLAAVAALSALGLLAASAPAATITVGSVLPSTFTPTEFGKATTQFNTALPQSGANLVSPVDGAILRWRIQGAKGGPFYLRVLRPNGKGAFEAVGTSLGATPANEGIQTFSTSLRIKAGDLIGIDATNPTDQIGLADTPGASFAQLTAPLFENATVAPSETISGKELELSAEVQPRPAITVIAPNSGPIGGGTKVTITGSGLTAASGVKFGDVSAASFSVESDTEITATVPAVAKPGSVDLTVTTVAGTNPEVSAARFTYTACVVPKLKGETLPAAKRALRRADCKLGSISGDVVKGKPAKDATVVKQSRKPRTVLQPGAKVNLKLEVKEKPKTKQKD